MKKLFFILLISFSSLCKASNLEFSQVILIDGSVAFSRTVPTGKVWKIDSAPSEGGDIVININGKEAILNFTSGPSYLPLWLPEGTIITEWVPTNIHSGWISIIEYNVVP